MVSHAAAVLAGSVALALTALLAFKRSLYVSALCLLGVLMQAAVLFYFSGAPLLAFIQVLVYAGAVMVLVVVAIMAAPVSAERLWSRLTVPAPMAVVGALLPAALFVSLLCKAPPQAPAAAAGPAEALLGSVLFGPYALATEAVTILILLAALSVVGERK